METENKENKQEQKRERYEERMVRLLSEDIEGKMTVYAGLTKIKGISWAMANAICKLLNINKTKKIGELSPEEIKKISDFVKIQSYLLIF